MSDGLIDGFDRVSLPGDGVHVLRPRTGEFIDSAAVGLQMRPGINEDGSDDARDISRRNRVGLALAERQVITPGQFEHMGQI